MANISTITIDPTVAAICPITFDGSYKGDQVQQQICAITGYPGAQGWSVLETLQNEEGADQLALVHYEPEGVDAYGSARGDVYDLEVGALIAKSFGYTPTAVTDQLVVNDGLVDIKDENGRVHTFDINNCKIKRGVECVVFRVVRHGGKTYMFTHRRLSPGRSRWGSSPYFVSMYTEAGGPTEEQLFDLSKPYSNTCYVFAVVHPALLVGTRQVVTKPYIVHLASFTMDIKRPDDQVAPGVATFTTSSEIGATVDQSYIHSPPDLDLEQANAHLKYGYYDPPAVETVTDPRQQTGEMLIVYSLDEATGNVLDIVKVHSTSYEWRITMRGNNPNVVNQFYAMLSFVYDDLEVESDWNNFKKRLILLPPYSEQDVRNIFDQNQAILNIPEGVVTPDMLASREDRIHLLWMNYVLSLPPHAQKEGLDILSRFKADRTAVINWLQNLETSKRDIQDKDITFILPTFPDMKLTDQQRRKYNACFNRVKNIIGTARSLARRRVTDRTNYSMRGAHMNLPTLIKSTIRNFIFKEEGPSLYNLIKLMKESQQGGAISSY